MDMFYADIGSSPASVNRRTGDILLNERTFDNIEKDIQDFILEHEKGHFVEQTSNEITADSYASSHYFGTRKKSLKKSLGALGNFLNVDGNAVHNERYFYQLKRALAYDYAMNNNEKALIGLQKLKQKESSNSNFDGNNNIEMSGGAGFTLGFFSTIGFMILIIVGIIYLSKKTGFKI